MNLYEKLVHAALHGIADNLHDMSKSGQSTYCPQVSVERMQEVVDKVLDAFDTAVAEGIDPFAPVENVLHECSPPMVRMAIRNAIQDQLEHGWNDESIIEELTELA